MTDNTKPGARLDRRSFLKGGSVATVMIVAGQVGAPAAEEAPKPAAAPASSHPPDAPVVRCAVIGCGTWGRELIHTLARLPNAPIVAVCDKYELNLRRVENLAPQARPSTDFKTVLSNPDVQAVLVATPTHLHKDVVLAALQAGKHVYCEAPLAHTLEDARAIARAAQAAEKVHFQTGLQWRADPYRNFVLSLIRSGVMGKPIKARAQWHKKQSWRRTSANPEREKELNWRLDRATSPGLVAEVGVHQLDLCSWVFNERPISVFGSGEVLQWNDGRDVPDTVQAIVEYPGGVRLFYEATLANSFEAEYEVLYGADSAVMLRGARGWMFKEADSPALGWEMHAKKEEFFQDTGITLIANASKQAPATDKPIEATAPEKTPLQAAIEAFVANAANHAEAVADFVASFGEGAQGLGEFLAKTLKNHLPCAGWREGWEATVVALRTNEAILKGQKLLLDKSAFEV